MENTEETKESVQSESEKEKVKMSDESAVIGVENAAKPTPAETPKAKYIEKENYSDQIRPERRRGAFATLVMIVLLLLLNGLFVLGAVDLLFKYKYTGGIIQNVQPVQVLEEQSQVIDVAKKASPAVVSIIATAEVPKYETQYKQFYNFQVPSQVQNGTVEQQIGAGSGFIVSDDGYIITNKHVVDDLSAKYTVILNDDKHKNEKVEAEVIARDPNSNRDIAILKINKTDLPFLNLGDSDSLQVGQTAVAIGYALGEFDNTVSKGVVSGLHRSISASGSGSGTETLSNLIQTDAAVNPGNSGGPLLDIGGNVVGVNVAMADAQSIGFAIPINDVKSGYEQVRKSGSIQKEAKAYLGVRYLPVDAGVQSKYNLSYNYGVIIVRGDTSADLAVAPGSPADKAGLMENDIILEVNGTKIDDKNLLVDLISKYKPGDQVKLKVSQKGTENEVTVTLGQSN